MPPWNTYDGSTSKAVEYLGFNFISASWKLHKRRHLPIIPRTCSLRNARLVIETARKFEDLNPVVVIVFHPDDFKEFHLPPGTDEEPPFTDLEEFEKLSSMDKISTQYSD